MLDRNKLAYQLEKLASSLFPNLKNQKDLAELIWKQIAKDPSFIYKVENSKSSLLVPTWWGNLNDTFEIKNDLQEYSVLAVDGSQIYPDRHLSGSGCFLINTGGCKISYGIGVTLFSEPQVFLIQDLLKNEDIPFSSDLVDLKREELEFKKMFEIANKSKPVCFVDGSLIFWYLESKQKEVKDKFLNVYLSYLEKFYQEKILIAGYISFPKSRELVNLIRLGLCRFTLADCIACHKERSVHPACPSKPGQRWELVEGCKQVDNLIDTQIARFFLKKNERTTIFYSSSKIIQDYPDHLKPSFFYLNVGVEIVRIEIPFWIAQNYDYLDLICKVAIDQSAKGQGYPVVLAEAHEQAVVKGPDRNFFYHLIQKVGIEQKRRFFMSQKSLKKRGLGI